MTTTQRITQRCAYSRIPYVQHFKADSKGPLGERPKRETFINILIALSVICGIGSATAIAQVGGIHFEIGDAGQLPPTAQMVPAGVNRIHGAISPLGDVDLYLLTFGVAASVQVQIPLPGPIPDDTWFDTDVTIFDSLGHPLSTHDAVNFNFDVIPGSYYFAIADWNIAATDASGEIIADDYTEILDPTGVLGGWLVTSSPLRGGSYEVVFSVATIPEPSTGALFLLGIAGLGVYRRGATD